MATPDFDNVTAGPAQFLLEDAEIGHTSGGIKVTITPKNRMRVVDQFGEGECAVIHTGDTVRIAVPFSEWISDVLQEVYNPGFAELASSDGTYLGIGRSAGYIYTDKDAKIVPRLSADANKKLQFFRVTPVGQFELNHDKDNDRIFNVEFTALVDEDQDDGELIGKIFVAAA